MTRPVSLQSHLVQEPWRGALARLLAAVEEDSEDGRLAANLLLAWQSSDQYGGWDPAELGHIDHRLADDMLTVLCMIRDSHCRPDSLEYGAEIRAAVGRRRWNRQSVEEEMSQPVNRQEPTSAMRLSEIQVIQACYPDRFPVEPPAIWDRYGRMKDTPERRAKFQKGYKILREVLHTGKTYKEIGEQYQRSGVWARQIARSTAFAWAEYEGIPLLEVMSLPWPEDGMTVEELERELALKRDFDTGRAARREREVFDATKPHRWRDGWMQEHHQLLAYDRNRVMERRAQEDAEEVEQLRKLRVPAHLST